MTKKLLYSILFLATFFVANGQDRELAMRLYNENKYAEAAEIFEKLYRSQPDEANYAALLDCYKALKDFDEAANLINKRLKRNSDPRLLVDLGYVYQLQKQPEKANAQYDEALNSVTKNPGLAYSLSEYFSMYGLYPQALTCYVIAERSNPNMQFHYQKALIYAEMGDMNNMISEYLLLIDQSPNYYQSVRERMGRNITNDPENEVNVLFRKQLILKIQESQNPIFSQMLIWLYIEEGEYAKALRQQKALDKRGEVMDADIFALGEKALDESDFLVAADAFSYLTDKGNVCPFYEEALYKSLVVQRTVARKNPESKPSDYKTLVAAHYKALPQLNGDERYVYTQRDIADILFFNLNLRDSATRVLGRTIANFENTYKRPVGECKMLLGDFQLAQGIMLDAIFTYMQVERSFTESDLGDQAKYMKGMVAYYTFDFGWALAQFEALKSSTTKLISNDALEMALLITDNSVEDTLFQGLTYYARGDYFHFRNKLDSALQTFQLLLDVFPDHAIREETRLYMARILVSQQKYTEATTTLETMLSTGGDIWADDALMLLGEVYATHLANTEKAMLAYEKILFNHPGSSYVPEARRRYRKLRGDGLVN
jgi:tetratricopeptide (TPR) repeat protein